MKQQHWAFTMPNITVIMLLNKMLNINITYTISSRFSACKALINSTSLSNKLCFVESEPNPKGTDNWNCMTKRLTTCKNGATEEVLQGLYVSISAPSSYPPTHLWSFISTVWMLDKLWTDFSCVHWQRHCWQKTENAVPVEIQILHSFYPLC